MHQPCILLQACCGILEGAQESRQIPHSSSGNGHNSSGSHWSHCPATAQEPTHQAHMTTHLQRDWPA